LSVIVHRACPVRDSPAVKLVALKLVVAELAEFIVMLEPPLAQVQA
jgi:hypothetical protein